MTRSPKIRQINVDAFLAESSLPYDDYAYLEVILGVTRVLDRLYGRQVAQRYFTKHISFDSITITVK